MEKSGSKPRIDKEPRVVSGYNGCSVVEGNRVSPIASNMVESCLGR